MSASAQDSRTRTALLEEIARLRARLGAASAGARSSGAEEELAKLNRTLRALSNSSQALARAEDEAGFLEAVCRLVVSDCGHAMVWIGYAEDDDARSVRPVASAGFDVGYLAGLKISWADTERGRGPTGTAIRTGAVATCRHMLTDPRFAPWREEAISRGYASSVSLPLLSDGRAFGAITLYSGRPDSFSPDELGLLSELANDLAFGIMTMRARSARLRAEEALRLSELRYRNLFNTMSEGFALYETIADDAGRPTAYRFLEVNPAFERTTGRPAAKVLGRTLRAELPGAGPLWVERFGRVLATGQAEQFESFDRDAGRWYDVHAFRAEPGRVAVVFADVTERKLAEEEFRQAVASQAYDRLFAMLREFQHGEGLAMNLHRLSLFARNIHLLHGRPGGEAPAAPAGDAAPEDARTSAWARLDIAIREFHAVGYRTLLNISSLLCSVESDFNDGASPRDVHLSGAEIRALAERLSADLDELMRIVRVDGPPEPARPALAVGERIAEHVETLHRKLAAVTLRLRTRYTVDLSDAVGAVTRSFRTATPGVAIDFADESPGLRALISQVDLNQLLGLLIGNALDALAGIGSAHGGAPGSIVVRIREAGTTAIIEVDDTGPGVPAELRDRLFDQGFSTKGGERGLGLSFALGHVARYGGRLAHDPSYAGGARFRLELVRV